MQCHRCNDHSKCLSCDWSDIDTIHTNYLFDFVQPVQQETTEPKQATNLPEDVEDRLRIFFFKLFSLNPLELLGIQAQMNDVSLSEFSRQLTKLFKKYNNHTFSRFHCFQLRKSTYKKIPELKSALFQTGQRKPGDQLK